MLADEYILIFLSLSAHIRLTEYNSSTLHNFIFSFSIGFSCRLTEHRIPAQQQALPLAAILLTPLVRQNPIPITFKEYLDEMVY
jgi:hypothetical protein